MTAFRSIDWSVLRLVRLCAILCRSRIPRIPLRRLNLALLLRCIASPRMPTVRLLLVARGYYTWRCCSVCLVLLFGILARGVKIYAPEVRGWRQELHSDPHAF